MLVRYNNVHGIRCIRYNHIIIIILLYLNHARGLHQVPYFYKRVDVKKAACKPSLKFKCPLIFYIYTDTDNILTPTTLVAAASLASIFTVPSCAVAALALTIVTCHNKTSYCITFIGLINVF